MITAMMMRMTTPHQRRCLPSDRMGSWRMGRLRMLSWRSHILPTFTHNSDPPPRRPPVLDLPMLQPANHRSSQRPSPQIVLAEPPHPSQKYHHEIHSRRRHLLFVTRASNIPILP